MQGLFYSTKEKILFYIPRKYTGKGYSIVKGSKPYKVMHYIDDKLKLYGYFKTEQEAIKAVNIIRNESNK